MIARVVEYSRTHPEWKRAQDAARYAMTRGAVDAERFTLDEIAARDHGICYLCGREAQSPTMDHVIPVSLGGPHTRVNVRLACRSCNSRKRQQLLPEGVYNEE
jgi:5-methylcytosine-specific restriction endonuclease McrA